MDRKRLARIAFATAADRLLADMRAGKISRDAAATKLAALKAAKDKRDAQLDLSAFARRHGLTSTLKVA